MYKVYLDTNIWIDYAADRDMRAQEFLIEAIKCKYSIVISDVVLIELSKYAKLPTSLVEILKKLNKWEFYKATPKQVSQANNQIHSHFADRLHTIVAIDSNCDFILTQNKRDFPQKIAKSYDDLRYL